MKRGEREITDVKVETKKQKVKGVLRYPVEQEEKMIRKSTMKTNEAFILSEDEDRECADSDDISRGSRRRWWSSLCQCRFLTFPEILMIFWNLLHIGGSRWMIDSARWAVSCMSRCWLPSFLHHQESIWYFKTNQSLLALTIDDAPGLDEKMGLDVLALLRRYQVKATFFIISDNISRYSQENVMKQMVQEGHELGNHMVVDKPCANMENDKFEEALMECERALCEFDPTFHQKSFKWFRAPSGAMSVRMKDVLGKKGYTSVMADVYPIDVLMEGHPDLISKFCAHHAKAGSIICLHFPSTGFRSTNFKVLEVLLPRLSHDFRCVTLTELLLHSTTDSGSSTCGGSAANQEASAT